jgi:hypothetical protein
LQQASKGKPQQVFKGRLQQAFRSCNKLLKENPNKLLKEKNFYFILTCPCICKHLCLKDIEAYI